MICAASARSPRRLSASDLNRFRYVNWTVDVASACHGFAGYFTAVLFGDKSISTLPDSHTKNLISWFPVFFPIRTQVMLKIGNDKTVLAWSVDWNNTIFCSSVG